MELKDVVKKIQDLLLTTNFVERCVTFNGETSLQIKTTEGDVINLCAVPHNTKFMPALVNQRMPHYRRENMGLNPNIPKNIPLIRAVEEKLREEKEFLDAVERSKIQEDKND